MPVNFREGSNVVNSIFGKSQEPIKMFLEKRAEAFEAQSAIPSIFIKNKSKHWGEKYTSMTSMTGFMPVGENGSHPSDDMQEGFSKFLENMTWKDRFSLSREIIDDAIAMDLRQKPQAFITGYYRTREQFGAALLGNALQGNTSAAFRGKSFDTKSADGVCLFSTAHPSVLNSSSTQTNLFSDAFDADALGKMEAKMQAFTDDNGNILDVAPDTIIIPNDATLKKAVFAAIGADKDPSTANNGWNYQFGRWNVVVWAYLNQFIASGTSPWILASSGYNDDNGGAIWQDRVDLEVTSTIDEDTDANVWNGYARFTAGFNDWRAFAAGGVSGGSNL